MSEPAWVPLGYGGGVIDYVGGWASGVTYQPGAVVRHNGIEYLAVNPSTGQQPGAAYPLLQGSELSYTEITADVTVPATTEAGATTIITAPAVTLDGATKIQIEFYGEIDNSAGNQTYFVLYQDGVSIGRLTNPVGIGGAVVSTFWPVLLRRVLTPAAGTRTFSIRAYGTAGSTSIVRAGAGGLGVLFPAHIRISTVQPTAVSVRTFTAPGIGTTLPASPVDGDEYILVDSLTAPTYQWHFRYMAAKASNKWVFIGGAETYAEVTAAEAINSGTYLAVTTPGPSIVIPVAGDYYVEQGFWSNTSSSALYTLMSYDIGGTAAVDADAAKNMVTQAGFQTASVMRRRRKSLPAVTLTAKYRTVSGSCTILDRWMSAIPIAVGG